jgi:hypothetical protein
MRGKTFGIAESGAGANTVKVIAADGTVTIRSAIVQRDSIHKLQRATVIAEAPQRRIMANDARFGNAA